MVEDVDAVRALASPHRVAILSYLLSGGARTATECAAEVGGTASACSYHLRELERFGLVERVESQGDGRARPWRAAAVGFSIGGGLLDQSPAARAAELALTRAELVENQRLLKRFINDELLRPLNDVFHLANRRQPLEVEHDHADVRRVVIPPAVLGKRIPVAERKVRKHVEHHGLAEPPWGSDEPEFVRVLQNLRQHRRLVDVLEAVGRVLAVAGRWCVGGVSVQDHPRKRELGDVPYGAAVGGSVGVNA